MLLQNTELSMTDKDLIEMQRHILHIDKMKDMSDARKMLAIYAWVEQKVRNELVRDYNRDWQCPICGAEKPSK